MNICSATWGKVALVTPTYIGLWDHFYVAPSLPGLRFARVSGGMQSFSVGLSPTAGYAFGAPASRFRPVVGLVYQASATYMRFSRAGIFQGDSSSQQWSTGQTLDIRLGVFARISQHIWLGLLVTAPSGYSLFRFDTRSGVNAEAQFFGRLYKKCFPPGTGWGIVSG